MNVVVDMFGLATGMSVTPIYVVDISKQIDYFKKKKK